MCGQQQLPLAHLWERVSGYIYPLIEIELQ